MEWIVLALVVAAAAGWRLFGGHPWRLVRARRVVVNLRSGQALHGLLVRQSGPLLFMAEAQLLEGNNSPVPIDGQAVVERSSVDFIQIL